MLKQISNEQREHEEMLLAKQLYVALTTKYLEDTAMSAEFFAEEAGHRAWVFYEAFYGKEQEK